MEFRLLCRAAREGFVIVVSLSVVYVFDKYCPSVKFFGASCIFVLHVSPCLQSQLMTCFYQSNYAVSYRLSK